MKPLPRLAAASRNTAPAPFPSHVPVAISALVLALAACAAHGQDAPAAPTAPLKPPTAVTPAVPGSPAAPAPAGSALAADAAATAEPSGQSAMDADMFYRLLLGELSATNGEPETAFALILDSARRSNDEQLYERAVSIALQARKGESALMAAQAWKTAAPKSREANRFVLQILLGLNRVAETAEPLRAELNYNSDEEMPRTLALVPRLYSRVTDRKLAASVVEHVLEPELAKPAFAQHAWTAVGRMRLAANDLEGAVAAAGRAQAADPTAEGPAILGIELMGPKLPQAEVIVKRYLDGKPIPELRMGYVRALVDNQRYAEATKQLQSLTADKPDLADAWLMLGTLQAQDNQGDLAEASLKRYIALMQGQTGTEEGKRGLGQAYLALSQIAEKRKDLAGAEAWLARIEDSQDLVAARARRASILARQGKVEEARELIRTLPGRNPAEIRMRFAAEVQLLREAKRYQDAYDLTAKVLETSPDDTDLLYDQATLAEKLGNMSEMERLLRKVIALKPEAHHAYNALGYSLADRNVRLDEARSLIRKALEFAPDDPFIQDSLGWVEFRAGNRAEAQRILDAAFKARPDAEIAAHLGEVLWTGGQRDRALAVWREGATLSPDNETLQETLKRLRAKL